MINPERLKNEKVTKALAGSVTVMALGLGMMIGSLGGYMLWVGFAFALLGNFVGRYQVDVEAKEK